MFLKTEFFLPPTARCLLASAALVVLAACSSSPASHGAELNAQGAVAPIAANGAVGTTAARPAAPASAAHAPDDGPGMLAYADRARLMTPAALGAEVARLGEAPTPAAQLQLALALGQLRQLPELIRAQELLARVLGNAQAQPLHALARLLAARYAEQRRLEEQLEKQTQQVRELQRKLDQSNERLEALKAIERSLTSRPAAPLPPARRVRPGP